MRLKHLAIAIAMLLAAPAFAQDFPLTIEHKFGETVIPEKPERVASVDYSGADDLLALGVQPATSRYWFGPYENGIWPWAQPLLESEPEVLRGDLDFETVAAANPDVIIAVRSGIGQKDYEQLSAIAPVVAVPEGVGDYSLPWDERAMLIGRVLGKRDEAAAVVESIRARFAAARQAHPDWAGKIFVMAAHGSGTFGAYAAEATRVTFVESMGLTLAPAVAELSVAGEFFISLSEESLPDLDADVLFWSTPDGADEVLSELSLRPLMRAHKEGREIMLPVTSPSRAALTYGSLLSLPHAVDLLEPRIEAAIDGDPATEVPPSE